MRATRVTSSEFRQAYVTLSDKARQEPVVITEHGRDPLVIMSVAEWERLCRRDRHVGLATELSDEWIAAVGTARVSDEFAHLDDELK